MPVDVSLVDEVSSEAAPAEVTPAEAVPTEAAAPAEEYPAWLKEVEAEIPDEAVETPQLKGVTEWLETVNTGDLATGPVGITDFLKKVESGEETSSAEPGPSAVDIFPWMREEKGEETGETLPITEIPPAVPAEELPDWMREIEAGLPVAAGEQGGSAAEGQGAAETEFTDTTPTTAEEVPGEATPAFEGEIPAGLNLDDPDAALAWLEGLAAKQGVPEEELITKPEERAEIPSISEAHEASVTEAPAAPAEEIPDWLKAVEAEVPEEIAPAVEVVPAVLAEEVPDWLKAAEAEVPEEIAPAAEVVPAVLAEEVPDWLKAAEAEVPEEIAPAAESGLPAGLDLTDQDAALAWLEGLAAKQGVPEEELITKPEERAEIPSIGEVQEPEVSEAVSLPAEELPEWMKEIETEAVTPTVEAVPAVPAEEAPDWLKAVEAEVPEEIAPAAEVTPAVPSRRSSGLAEGR